MKKILLSFAALAALTTSSFAATGANFCQYKTSKMIIELITREYKPIVNDGSDKYLLYIKSSTQSRINTCNFIIDQYSISSEVSFKNENGINNTYSAQTICVNFFNYQDHLSKVYNSTKNSKLLENYVLFVAREDQNTFSNFISNGDKDEKFLSEYLVGKWIKSAEEDRSRLSAGNVAMHVLYLPNTSTDYYFGRNNIEYNKFIMNIAKRNFLAADEILMNFKSEGRIEDLDRLCSAF